MSLNEGYCQVIQADPRGETWSEAARKHVGNCPSCAVWLEGCARLGERLRALPSSRAEMPAPLREAMLQQLAEAEVPSAGKTLLELPVVRRIMLPVALAASLVLGIVLEKAFEFGTPSFPVEVEKSIGLYIADVTHDHFLLERIARPLEVEITSPADLSAWLSASLGFKFQLPESRGSFALQGGRVWHTVGRLSAMASYTTESGSRVVIFAVPAENLKLNGAESIMVGETRVFTGRDWGHEARVWIDGDLAIALTAPEGELPAAWDEFFLP